MNTIRSIKDILGKANYYKRQFRYFRKLGEKGPVHLSISSSSMISLAFMRPPSSTSAKMPSDGIMQLPIARPIAQRL